MEKNTIKNNVKNVTQSYGTNIKCMKLHLVVSLLSLHPVCLILNTSSVLLKRLSLFLVSNILPEFHNSNTNKLKTEYTADP